MPSGDLAENGLHRAAFSSSIQPRNFGSGGPPVHYRTSARAAEDEGLTLALGWGRDRWRRTPHGPVLLKALGGW
jgi:hypothetical protein